MDLIYRVQDKDGRGPWKPGFSLNWVESRDDHENLHPWTYEFGPVHRYLLSGEYGGSGCLTEDQLRRWFTPSEYKTLIAYGYHAVKMRVNRILASSPIQCVFGRAKPLTEDIEVFDLYPSERSDYGKPESANP